MKHAHAIRLVLALVLTSAFTAIPALAQTDDPRIRLGQVSFVWNAEDFRQTRIFYELRNDSDRTLLGYALEISFQDAATGTMHQVMQVMAANLPAGQIYRPSITISSCYAIDEVTQLEEPARMYIAGLTARVSASLLSGQGGDEDTGEAGDSGYTDESTAGPAQSADRFAFPPYDLPPLVVACAGYAPPYLFAPDGLEPIGYDVEVLKRIAAQLGRSLVIKQMSGTVEDCLADPEVELVAGGLPELQTGSVRLSASIAPAYAQLIVAEPNSALLAGGSALAGAIVGVPAYGPLAGKLRTYLESAGARVFEYDDAVQALYQLRMGDYQALAEDPALFATIVGLLGLPIDGLTTALITTQPGSTAESFASIAFAMRPEAADLAAAINQAIASLSSDGTLDELTAVWLSRP